MGMGKKGDKGPDRTLPEILRREKSLEVPDISEPEVVRHYTRLSQMNFGVDSGMYPLGSCTMKYNPRVNETCASFFEDFHPYMKENQGALELMHRLEVLLCEIGGVDAVTLQPPAGAAGEYTAMSMTRAHLGKDRDEVIVPDSAHGTNPASASMAGFRVVEVPSNKNGTVDVEALKSAVSGRTACFMMTNPNTLGIFEDGMEEITGIVHESGALLYYDGANLNGIIGKVKPGDMGFDMVHFNLHKTFSTPHGTGGPGAGPVGVKAFLEDYLPIPMIREHEGKYSLDYNSEKTIGKVHEFYGNFGVLVKAYAYIRLMGKEGLTSVAEISTLNSNYMKEKLKTHYPLIFKDLRKHEFVLSAKSQGANYVAKRLLDYGVHAPTVHFPLIVDEALMIEPTESESKRDIDQYVAALIEISQGEHRKAPLNTSAKEVDAFGATKKPVVSWRGMRQG